MLQDEDGQIAETHSISAGLDYAAVGPEHAWLKDSGRVTYPAITDREALVLKLRYGLDDRRGKRMTLKEIGEIMGVTESRICQIHTKAIFQLRSRLSQPLPERGIVT